MKQVKEDLRAFVGNRLRHNICVFLRAIFEQDGDDPVPLQQKEGVKPSHAQDPQGSI